MMCTLYVRIYFTESELRLAQHLTLHVGIRQATSANYRRKNPRPACIGRGTCASEKETSPSTNDKHHYSYTTSTGELI